MSQDLNQDSHTLRSDGISATIAAHGAELQSLQATRGIELLWQAGPAWRRHAPILFPIVGRLKGDALRHRGRAYPMTQHGFARDRRFAWTERGPSSCTLVLTDDADTRSHYPFTFRLAVTYTVNNGTLEVAFAIDNPGDEALPASVGGHPAFNWPLLAELDKEAYRLTFSEVENAAIRRLADGLMRATPEPSPIQGDVLTLSEQLFDDDAIILDRPASTHVRYAADRGPSIEMAWQGFREFGIWSKPGGAAFLCLEPWHGLASPSDFDGEFLDKPGLMLIAPGTRRVLSYRISVE